MDFTVKNSKESIVGVARKLGYIIIDTAANGQYNLVRKLAGENYPRFHLYTTEQPAREGGGNNFNFSLHLDQKKPSYGGAHAHSGEYFGPLVEDEAKRIQDLLT